MFSYSASKYFLLKAQGKLYFSWYDPFNRHLNAPTALILAFLLHQSWDHVSTESFSYWIAAFLLLVDCDRLILFMLLLFLSLADWLLEWIWKICLYSGAAGYQRILLCGKQNHCGHYYYGTLSKLLLNTPNHDPSALSGLVSQLHCILGGQNVFLFYFALHSLTTCWNSRSQKSVSTLSVWVPKHFQFHFGGLL